MKGSSAMRLAWYYIKREKRSFQRRKDRLTEGIGLGYNLYEKQISNKDWWFGVGSIISCGLQATGVPERIT